MLALSLLSLVIRGHNHGNLDQSFLPWNGQWFLLLWRVRGHHVLFCVRTLWNIASVRPLWPLRRNEVNISKLRLSLRRLSQLFTWLAVTSSPDIYDYPYRLVAYVSPELFHHLTLVVMGRSWRGQYLIIVIVELHVLILRLLIYGLESLQTLLARISNELLATQILQGLQAHYWVCKRVAIRFAR